MAEEDPLQAFLENCANDATTLQTEIERNQEIQQKETKRQRRYTIASIAFLSLAAVFAFSPLYCSKPVPVVVCHHFDSNRYSRQEISDIILAADPNFDPVGLEVKYNRVVYCHSINVDNPK